MRENFVAISSRHNQLEVSESLQLLDQNTQLVLEFNATHLSVTCNNEISVFEGNDSIANAYKALNRHPGKNGLNKLLKALAAQYPILANLDASTKKQILVYTNADYCGNIDSLKKALTRKGLMIAGQSKFAGEMRTLITLEMINRHALPFPSTLHTAWGIFQQASEPTIFMTGYCASVSLALSDENLEARKNSDEQPKIDAYLYELFITGHLLTILQDQYAIARDAIHAIFTTPGESVLGANIYLKTGDVYRFQFDSGVIRSLTRRSDVSYAEIKAQLDTALQEKDCIQKLAPDDLATAIKFMNQIKALPLHPSNDPDEVFSPSDEETPQPVNFSSPKPFVTRSRSPSTDQGEIGFVTPLSSIIRPHTCPGSDSDDAHEPNASPLPQTPPQNPLTSSLDDSLRTPNRILTSATPAVRFAPYRTSVPPAAIALGVASISFSVWAATVAVTATTAAILAIIWPITLAIGATLVFGGIAMLAYQHRDKMPCLFSTKRKSIESSDSSDTQHLRAAAAP